MLQYSLVRPTDADGRAEPAPVIALRPDPTVDTRGEPHSTQGIRSAIWRTKRAVPVDLIEHVKMTCDK